MSEDEKYDKYGAGIFIVRAENANFNADFAGFPRSLPDENGTIYATDKALKYCIRKYLHEMIDSENEKVLLWRRRYPFDPEEMKKYNGKKKDLEGKPMELGDLIDYISKDLNHDERIKKLINEYLDLRLFGGTLAVEKHSISLTGPCQISYGVNVFKNSQTYVDQIQSPKPTKAGDDQCTLGSQVRNTEAHYIYDFSINPNNLSKDELLKSVYESEETKVLKVSDIERFKESITRGVNYTTSCTKYGAVGEFLLFIEFNDGDGDLKAPLLPLMQKSVKVDAENEFKRKIDLGDLADNLEAYKSMISKIELYYDPKLSSIAGKDKLRALTSDVCEKHILTHKVLDSGYAEES